MRAVAITRYNVGIDFGSEQMDARLAVQYVDGIKKNLFSRRFSNTGTGFKNLHEWIKEKCRCKDAQIRISCEATGYIMNSAVIFWMG